ncbi:TNN [Symbiodinium sp. CCMP2592]|nr:TNN [Symbiodinium sp. CCMP2592]
MMLLRRAYWANILLSPPPSDDSDGAQLQNTPGVKGHESVCVQLAFDSSPVKKDFMLIQETSMPYDQLLMHFRLYLRKNDVLKHIDAEDAAKDSDLMEGLQSSSRVRLLPPVCLGHAATDASHKYSALLHSISLETGPARDRYLRSVVACTTDQGK